ncbi:glycoside hydrolase family 47 protein [Lophiostoma macrostomum CBS 122681]|uniref:alpha-1,2-Mannosidase n=1 Tax=Lophiostoma macrostomum CBS 122681 TaxID=1314788 RepID=A0A6A6TN45_9PLEO|nr:glycoside hydrolase family 47 protein [Lophiostoma macrostomum CBS 122681]
MLRFRRFRPLVVFVVIALIVVYQFGGSSTTWRTSSTEQRPSEKEDTAALVHSKPRPQVAQQTKKLDLEVPAATRTQAQKTPPAISSVKRPVDKTPASSTTPVSRVDEGILPASSSDAELVEGIEGGQGRVEVTALASSTPPVHWSKQSEHYPVPSRSIIKLPTGKPKPIPKIQHTFKTESPAAKKDREDKLNVIKGVFRRSWDGYREYAWQHDELSPVSGKFRDPFASWRATLVDALDTLWIMGMKKEFEEAVKAVDEIDFTTSPRADIPLFETTIRYLGGLIAAYDLSDRKYKNLLTKAVELAEILISAFDTPNRMPQTYYYWRPSFASQSHRASNRIVMAEVGSLSVEFTRLAQLTGEDKYYDAIARITDALEEFQDKTRLPGMWPTYLDASGCRVPEPISPADVPLQAPLDRASAVKDIPLKAEDPTSTEKLSPEGNRYTPLALPDPIVFKAETGIPSLIPSPTEKLSPEGNKYTPLALPDPIVFKADTELPSSNPATEPAATKKGATTLQKRQLDDTEAVIQDSDEAPPISTALPTPECKEQGFASSNSGMDEYTLGGMSDSTYEYLPKEWLLLGGVVDKYRSMYEKSIKVVKENLIFRPMLPKGEDILFSGKLNVPQTGTGKLEAENAHLTCFAGGMFGMGAKIYDRPEDLDIAKKLTEGCVWSYDMTNTGIMPEAFHVVPCESTKGCEWNETEYWEGIDPNAEARVTSYERQMLNFREQMAAASTWYEEQMAAYAAATPLSKTAAGEITALATPTAVAELESGMEKRKRQLDADSDGVATQQKTPSRNLMVEGEMEEAEGPPTPVQSEGEAPFETTLTKPEFPAIYTPSVPLTHEQYVKNRIQEDRLPPGVVNVAARGYILRPEAIESVWYMYRITGDAHWREAGWRMFQAIEQHTATVYGNSAIDDVTKTSPDLNDEMESFWLAETLKYFYLLFSEEDVISLDEWVLNTEAHPFRRPT